MHPRLLMRRMTAPFRIASLLLACVVFAAALPAFAQVAVQRVDVRLNFEDVPPHPVIVGRLQAAAESVAERLLVGRPLDQLQAVQSRFPETIAGVLDRVATGYAVAGAAAQLGAISTVTVRLRTVGSVIRDAAVSTDLSVIHPKVRPLAEQALAPRVPEIRALLSNLPIAAIDWAEPAVTSEAKRIVEAALPGFTASIRIASTPTAAIDVGLAVRDGRIIRNIGVRFRSSSIPTLLLDQQGPQVVSTADPLRGLPVAFAEAHRIALARLINDDLAVSPPALEYHVVTSVGLDVGETTYVNVVADSLLYRGRVEAHLNIGPRAPNPSIVAHLGRLIIPSTEVFAELRLVPNTLSVSWDLGAQYQLSPDAALGLTYAFTAQTITAWTTVRLGRDVGVRGAWNLTQQAFEGAVMYRVNEFLAGEVVATSRGEVWLALISNL